MKDVIQILKNWLEDLKVVFTNRAYLFFLVVFVIVSYIDITGTHIRGFIGFITFVLFIVLTNLGSTTRRLNDSNKP